MPTSRSFRSKLLSGASALGFVLIATRATLLPFGASQQLPAAGDPFGASPWGDAVDGLQLRVSTGVNTESLTETRSLRYLTVQMRNVSNAPVAVDFDQATYDFEYESMACGTRLNRGRLFPRRRAS
jgi:hypothetical protein